MLKQAAYIVTTELQNVTVPSPEMAEGTEEYHRNLSRHSIAYITTVDTSNMGISSIKTIGVGIYLTCLI
jgi:hypothetical protein